MVHEMTHKKNQIEKDKDEIKPLDDSKARHII
jgi:hypothetical protein